MGRDSVSGNYFRSVRAAKRRNGKSRPIICIDLNGNDSDTVVPQFPGSGYNSLKKLMYNESLFRDGYQ
ncbi:MAG TPA: hypothetical protein VFX43_12575, partial [Chitinophagaceae bacterium]|nr:hypothetical protein [Chitinophagaceae bacterium]